MKHLLIASLFIVSGVAARGMNELTLSTIIENLEPGMNTGDVLLFLGDDFTRVTCMMVDAEVWRYDFPTVSGYTFEVSSGEDEVDTEGLGNGSMAMQIFVAWNESGLVGDYTVYTGSGNGVISEYRVFPDGSVRKSRI